MQRSTLLTLSGLAMVAAAIWVLGGLRSFWGIPLGCAGMALTCIGLVAMMKSDF